MAGQSGRPRGCGVQRAIAFGLWAAQQPRPPTEFEVMGQLGCSLSKAKRWRNAYLQSIPSQPLRKSH